MNTNFIQIRLEKDEVLKALNKAIKSDFIDNLRHRHPNVVLDSKLRGFVGEIAFAKWLRANEISIKASNFLVEESGMDIDFLVNGMHIELKTSLLPDADQSIENALMRRDIKLIKRKEKVEDLNGDFHVQIIFNQLRLRKDEWLENQKIDIGGGIEKLYDNIAAFRYERDCYLVGWIDKATLINQINKKAPSLRIWKYGMREFWTCNIEREAKQPSILIDFLKIQS